MSDTMTVHVVFKTHLDIGFTDYAANVFNKYITFFVPQALDLAQEMREGDSGNRFIWTTGSWLIYEFLEAADRAMRGRMEKAILAGDIVWHALPFTTHTEMMSADMFRAALSLSRELDARFGRETIAAKMTDVPGHCRSIIPHMAGAGVSFLHIGVNPASKPVDLPPIFRWRHPEGTELVVNYGSGYDAKGEVNDASDLIYFAHTGDNLGPPSASDLGACFAQLKERFPGYDVRASTMDDYARAIAPSFDSLPVVTEELGDTWIHGVGTDPCKVGRYRALSRLRSEWEERGIPMDNSRGCAVFTRKLLCIPEHTWGMDEKTHLKDYTNYSRPDFDAAKERDKVKSESEEKFGAFKMMADEESKDEGHAIHETGYRHFEDSWREQRAYIDQAVDILDEELKNEAVSVMAATEPSRSPLSGFEPCDNPDGTAGDFGVRFCAETGALVSLKTPGGDWHGSAEKPFCCFRYEVFDAANYERFFKSYNINHKWAESWARPDFTKPGLESVAGLKHGLHKPESVVFSRSGSKIQAEFKMQEELHAKNGAPREGRIVYDFSGSELNIDLQWFDKPANRMPEAFWLSFHPNVGEPGKWFMDKMGSPVSPFDVRMNGNRALHAVQDGISYTGKPSMRIRTLDALLVSPGRPRILDFDVEQPNLEEGWHFNLYNNLWGTNFPMWCSDDARFRFSVVW
ncbi:MAG: DUF5054 domain-containing protein [Planctomycetes bacterium]|nr:DUF5054 domain-containing protein [Planctomycetota bacterium]